MEGGGEFLWQKDEDEAWPQPIPQPGGAWLLLVDEHGAGRGAHVRARKLAMEKKSGPRPLGAARG